MTRLVCTFMVGLFMCVASAMGFSDDFDDNTQGPQWLLVQDNPAALNVVEQNQRLEVISTGTGNAGDDALYLSNGPGGFAMDTAVDFHLEVDFTLAGYTRVGGLGDGLAFVFGVGSDVTGHNSAAIGWALGEAGITVISEYMEASRVSNVQNGPNALGSASSALPETVTFVMQYDAANDDLTLSVKDTAISVLYVDMVQSVWAADQLLVSFGARGRGFALDSGDAYFDNFNIISGRVIPEPTSLALLGVGLIMLARRRRQTAAKT